MSAGSIPDLKRIQFFSGQRLTAQDMTAVQSANRELRWLHNRSLHGWGIGIGYGVAGETGDAKVTVDPGYAIDCLGREIVLTNQVSMTVPAIAGNSAGSVVTPATFFLTASYLDDTGQSTVENRPGVCLPGGTVRLTESPLLQWLQFKDIQNGLNIILAEASVLNCQLNAPLGLGVRRPARPSEQPYINAGQVTPDAITWIQVLGGVRAHVDTSGGQFRATPAYFAHVMGSRSVMLKIGGELSSISLITAVLVDNPAPDSFNCDVVLLKFDGVHGVPVQSQLIPAIIAGLQWTVVWMGVEG